MKHSLNSLQASYLPKNNWETRILLKNNIPIVYIDPDAGVFIFENNDLVEKLLSKQNIEEEKNRHSSKSKPEQLEDNQEFFWQLYSAGVLWFADSLYKNLAIPPIHTGIKEKLKITGVSIEDKNKKFSHKRTYTTENQDSIEIDYVFSGYKSFYLNHCDTQNPWWIFLSYLKDPNNHK